MATDEDRCPLCGGHQHDRYKHCDNPACELPAKHWPRVRELVAIRDAAVEYAVAWQQYVVDPCAGAHEAHREAAVRLRFAAIEYYRQEAEKGEKDVRERE